MFEIKKLRDKTDEEVKMIVNKRLYLTADKKHVVEGAPKAAYLFKAKGQEVSIVEIKKYPELVKYLDEKNMTETDKAMVGSLFGKKKENPEDKQKDKPKDKMGSKAKNK